MSDNLEENIVVRAPSKYKKALASIRYQNPEKYNNESHQVRAYIVRGIKQDGGEIEQEASE
jgi:hypothetical protein